MVRLKANISDASPKRKAVFQFHNGTIKSWGVEHLSILQDNFNSIMVRLKATQVQNAPRALGISIP